MRVNIYIRLEDEWIWNKLEDKPRWLHDNLLLQADEWKGEYSNEVNQR